jgi:hypothetical protein
MASGTSGRIWETDIVDGEGAQMFEEKRNLV